MLFQCDQAFGNIFIFTYRVSWQINCKIITKMVEKSKLKNVSDHETNQIWRTLAIGAIVLIVFLSLPQLCFADCGHSHDSHGHHDHHHHEHEHEHHHGGEGPSFKWSRQANEVYEQEEPHHDHQHHHHHDEHTHSHGTHHEHTSKDVQSKLIHIKHCLFFN